ncbi:hypothetical protein I4495_16285 [Klebsiella oxytoca]|uniref:hypothetical protein n=1 Tax=Klebsiella TaxID=570 RepID=UPI0018C4F245|nr:MULTISPECIES: hypothetical protein [Klebsiella]MBG2577068.1 hypothetical protein [Klebsiella oxytoca]MBZ7405061.1 hypothetical protein [Klebsiella grimontii]MCW9606707.1 hypothetical protein [Klebsiella oxytoca]MCW9673632.1 hypothetical protein [Klebsiella oxytoca]MDL5432881.1 hypothetical protein [Klebsiella michiganensis]
MGDVGDYYRDIAPYLKEGRKKARDGAHERIKAFFIKNGITFEEGSNTLVFRTPLGTVCYYTPSQKMQHKNKWLECSPTKCMKYVNKLRGN